MYRWLALIGIELARRARVAVVSFPDPPVLRAKEGLGTRLGLRRRTNVLRMRGIAEPQAQQLLHAWVLRAALAGS